MTPPQQWGLPSWTKSDQNGMWHNGAGQRAQGCLLGDGLPVLLFRTPGTRRASPIDCLFDINCPSGREDMRLAKRLCTLHAARE